MMDNHSLTSELFKELEKVEDNIQHAKVEKQKLVKRLFSSTKYLTEKDKQEYLTQLSSMLNADELTESQTRILSQLKVPLSNVASFREQLVQATRRRQLVDFQPEWMLNNKLFAYKFIDSLGIKRPETFAHNQPLASIQPQKKSVLKPVNGSSSRGVFIFDEQGGVLEVATGKIITTVAEAFAKANELLVKGIIKSDKWILEEFVGDFENEKLLVPRDLKFFSFFGEVGLILEIDRSGELRYCEWLPDGSCVQTGSRNYFLGNGFTEQELEIVKLVSKSIPAPFMRIDFLKSKNAFHFGEFTPRPGRFCMMYKSFDRYLGECYLQAQSRLFNQLADREIFKR
ncbi:ATP-grasp fold amidoligase family protein [Vibrio metschnikovii]|uniref:ATP-grasp fold amidoligase family protein n=1 Tax=Vibrio metschnikovii TaxID=28172 RepID=UPI002A5F564F|nr:hypothetical protein [Vibrio metschnikovii]EKO3733165.1 hypothetical protein [Vibrio metschnikovii]EKO3777298.1 hypothetical protein [Vibrio metschnikovii]